jgi:5-carboxymethyl-2-hydroxymuconate isomerase
LSVPHVIIEYAQELARDEQVTALLDAVHEAVAATELFAVSNIKTRAWPVRFYRVDAGPYVHVQCRIHGGRSPQQKKHLSEAVLAAVRGQAWPAAVITVEVIDMDRASYGKHTTKMHAG